MHEQLGGGDCQFVSNDQDIWMPLVYHSIRFCFTPNQHQPQPTSSTFLSQQISTSHHPQPAEQSDMCFLSITVLPHLLKYSHGKNKAASELHGDLAWIE